MKRFTLKGRLFVINLLINLLIIIIPIIVFAAFNCWPKIKATAILFWVSFGLFPLINIGWSIIELLRKRGEPSVAFIQIILNYVILVIPFINLIFALIPSEHVALFVVPLILDIIALIVFFSLTLLLSHAGNKMEESLENNKSEIIAPKPVENYENEDGSFAGASKERK